MLIYRFIRRYVTQGGTQGEGDALGGDSELNETLKCFIKMLKENRNKIKEAVGGGTPRIK